jgi:hypothetical protein
MQVPRKLIVTGAALLAVVGGGGAIAATKLTPKQESQAVVNDAADQLGVTPSALTAALKQALENRVDAAVAAGRLTEAQGNALKQRIQSGDVPLVGLGGGGPGFHHRGGPGQELQAAASYLGMTQAALRSSLENGQTLAQVAKAKGKSVDGLVAALVNAEKAHLAQAVKDGRLTDAQRDSIVSGLKTRVTAMVNGTGGPGFGRGGPGFGPPPGNGSAQFAPDMGAPA